MQIQMRQANQNGGVRHRKLVRCQSGCIAYQCGKQTGKQKHTNKIRKNNASAGSFVKIHINSIYAFTRLFNFTRNMITVRNATHYERSLVS